MSSIGDEAGGDLVYSLISKVTTDRDEAGIRTMPMFRSTVAILLFAPGFNNLLVINFSTARTTPSLHLIPIAVPPFSTALTAYSTYSFKNRSD